MPFENLAPGLVLLKWEKAVYFSSPEDLVCGLSPDLFTPFSSILRLGTVYLTMGRAGMMLQSSRERSMTDV